MNKAEKRIEHEIDDCEFFDETYYEDDTGYREGECALFGCCMTCCPLSFSYHEEDT